MACVLYTRRNPDSCVFTAHKSVCTKSQKFLKRSFLFLFHKKGTALVNCKKFMISVLQHTYKTHDFSVLTTLRPRAAKSRELPVRRILYHPQRHKRFKENLRNLLLFLQILPSKGQISDNVLEAQCLDNVTMQCRTVGVTWRACQVLSNVFGYVTPIDILRFWNPIQLPHRHARLMKLDWSITFHSHARICWAKQVKSKL